MTQDFHASVPESLSRKSDNISGAINSQAIAICAVVASCLAAMRLILSFSFSEPEANGNHGFANSSPRPNAESVRQFEPRVALWQPWEPRTQFFKDATLKRVASRSLSGKRSQLPSELQLN